MVVATDTALAENLLQMHDGKRSIIHLLDGQQLELTIQPRLVVHELLNIIASHVALKDGDKQYFGLAYVDHLSLDWITSRKFDSNPKETVICQLDLELDCGRHDRCEIWLVKPRKVLEIEGMSIPCEDSIDVDQSKERSSSSSLKTDGNNEQYHWLPTDRRVLECDVPRKSHQSHAVLELHHSVKFFVDSILTLCHPSAVELYFLETAKRLVKGLLEFTDLEYYKIASSFLQIYCGNYVRQFSLTVYESAVDLIILHFRDEKARCVLTELVPIPSGMLHTCDVTLEDVEKNVIELYKDLSDVPKGVAILNFLQTAERSSTHGCHFYQVRDKAGQPWTVGISNKGIFQYEPADISKPKKVFNWSLLDNLYYRDRKFSIEVRNARVIQSSGNANSILDSKGCLDSDDELAKAVKDPTTQVSVSRRSVAPAVQVHAFYCDTNFLCKTIWSTAISLHQFYLDQRTCASANKGEKRWNDEESLRAAIAKPIN
ncbi:unnamed protein product [Litomosoides sigmodontis]|uniref:FERM domain-containing protein n=1 Tax=Litomosoides sigmodontis TaxID=42156 RepID=A0A3P7KE47_LITSI|nr:unnamed protein product [Litomosoides sigmodontis]